MLGETSPPPPGVQGNGSGRPAGQGSGYHPLCRQADPKEKEGGGVVRGLRGQVNSLGNSWQVIEHVESEQVSLCLDSCCGCLEADESRPVLTRYIQGAPAQSWLNSSPFSVALAEA